MEAGGVTRLPASDSITSRTLTITNRENEKKREEACLHSASHDPIPHLLSAGLVLLYLRQHAARCCRGSIGNLLQKCVYTDDPARPDTATHTHTLTHLSF